MTIHLHDLKPSNELKYVSVLLKTTPLIMWMESRQLAALQQLMAEKSGAVEFEIHRDGKSSIYFEGLPAMLDENETGTPYDWALLVHFIEKSDDWDTMFHS